MKQFIFEAVAKKSSRQSRTNETGAWTDGIGVFCDNDDICAYRLSEGDTYKITIEKVVPQQITAERVDNGRFI